MGQLRSALLFALNLNGYEGRTENFVAKISLRLKPPGLESNLLANKQRAGKRLHRNVTVEKYIIEKGKAIEQLLVNTISLVHAFLKQLIHIIVQHLILQPRFGTTCGRLLRNEW